MRSSCNHHVAQEHVARIPCAFARDTEEYYNLKC
ncbi:hypothetical protein ABIA06_005972 [Bradyrhizobium yuanmingense]